MQATVDDLEEADNHEPYKRSALHCLCLLQIIHHTRHASFPIPLARVPLG